MKFSARPPKRISALCSAPLLANAPSSRQRFKLTALWLWLLVVSSLAVGTSLHAGTTPDVTHHTHRCATSGEVISESARINSVSDGDTVVLSDGRKVRIIGINAPELSKKSERALADEAIQAKVAVEQLVRRTPDVTLALGDESHDQYGRLLAHVVFPDGTSLATTLLAKGLAAATAVAPNTRCADYFHRIEQSARSQRQGVWFHANNPWFANDVKVNDIYGFHIITGNVESTKFRRGVWTFTLQQGIKITASKGLITEAFANELKNKTIEIRGWFGRYNGATSVKLHHASNLKIKL